MPSIEEIREWLRGKNVAGLPDRKGKWDFPVEAKGKRGLDMGKMKEATEAMKRFGAVAGAATHKYRISAEGDDAVLLFGKHKGKEVSTLAKKEPGYLSWMLRQEFPEELLEIVHYQLSKTGRITPPKTKSGSRIEFRASGSPPKHYACRSEIITEDEIE